MPSKFVLHVRESAMWVQKIFLIATTVSVFLYCMYDSEAMCTADWIWCCVVGGFAMVALCQTSVWPILIQIWFDTKKKGPHQYHQILKLNLNYFQYKLLLAYCPRIYKEFHVSFRAHWTGRNWNSYSPAELFETTILTEQRRLQLLFSHWSRAWPSLQPQPMAGQHSQAVLYVMS